MHVVNNQKACLKVFVMFKPHIAFIIFLCACLYVVMCLWCAILPCFRLNGFASPKLIERLVISSNLPRQVALPC
jgi:hypothetical protein